MEKEGIWHPGINLNNILFQGSKEKFKLSNPFIHDRFLREYNRKSPNLDRETVETEINKNTKQLGVTLLGLTSLANMEELRGGKDLNQETVAKAMNITKLLYSGELYSVITYLLHGKYNDEKLTFQKLRKGIIDASHEIKEKKKDGVSFFDKTVHSNQKVRIFDKENPGNLSMQNSEYSRILPPEPEYGETRVVNNRNDRKMPYLENSIGGGNRREDSKDVSLLSQILNDKKNYNESEGDGGVILKGSQEDQSSMFQGAVPNNSGYKEYHGLNGAPFIFHKNRENERDRGFGGAFPQLSPIRPQGQYNGGNVPQDPITFHRGREETNNQPNSILKNKPFFNKNDLRKIPNYQNAGTPYKPHIPQNYIGNRNIMQRAVNPQLKGADFANKFNTNPNYNPGANNYNSGFDNGKLGKVMQF